MNLEHTHLYTFVDSAFLHGRTPGEIARELCAGGSDIIQLRAKDWPESKVLETARELRAITNEAGVGLVINDHPRVAKTIGADLCHLGQEDFFEAGFTRKTQLDLESVHLGLSSHAPDQAVRAINAGADYIAIGPVYPTGTKPNAKPVTLEYVRWASNHVRIPWFAIGGITLDNLDEVLAAGATRICVVSAILNSEDIAKACQSFRKHLPSAP